MKYWDFSVANLISDYPKNQRTLAGIKEGLEYCRRLLKDPLTEKTEGDVKAYIRMLELRESEYQWYVDMVTLGFNDLPEIERNVLRWWLIDKYPEHQIMEEIGCETHAEMRRIKNIALTKFHDVVLP